MSLTVIQHVLNSLYELGISEIFGVPGDYAFPVNDAICSDKRFRWIGDCNELNAAYAADGYARIKGFGALCTTFGVGELSAMNGIAGAYAERLPIFHLVGMPSRKQQSARRLLHHTTGIDDFEIFYEMSSLVSAEAVILDPAHAFTQVQKTVKAAIEKRKPVYLGLCSDVANAPITESPIEKMQLLASDPHALNEAASVILKQINGAKKTCVIPGILLERYQTTKDALDFINAACLPFATMLMDKGVLGEDHPNFIGMLAGTLLNPEIHEFIKECDLVLILGAALSDINTGMFTTHIDKKKTVHINAHSVSVGYSIYHDVEMKDLLQVLAKNANAKPVQNTPKVKRLEKATGNDHDAISENHLYPLLETFFKPNDCIIVETGTCLTGLANASLPKGASFQSQALWGSIGWATPASLGACLADPKRRLILVTGEGAHQCTAQEVSQIYRYGLHPIIFVLNNEGYLIERLLCKNPDIYYNDIAKWNYTKIPEAFGCKDWLVAKVSTFGELKKVMHEIETSKCASYVEIVTEKYVSPILSKKFQQLAKQARN